MNEAKPSPEITATVGMDLLKTLAAEELSKTLRIGVKSADLKENWLNDDDCSFNGFSLTLTSGSFQVEKTEPKVARVQDTILGFHGSIGHGTFITVYVERPGHDSLIFDRNLGSVAAADSVLALVKVLVEMMGYRWRKI